MVICDASIVTVLAWRARAFFCHADRSFLAALAVEGAREAFLSMKESLLLKPQD